jgi:hypothetical protein
MRNLLVDAVLGLITIVVLLLFVNWAISNPPWAGKTHPQSKPVTDRKTPVDTAIQR